MYEDLCQWLPYLYFKPNLSWALDLKLPDNSSMLPNISMSQTQFLTSSLKFAFSGFDILVNSITSFFSLFFTTALIPHPLPHPTFQQVLLAFPSKYIPNLTISILTTLVTVILFPATTCPIYALHRSRKVWEKMTSGILPLICFSKYSRTILNTWINARSKDPNARDPVWYLAKDKMRAKVKISLLLTKRLSVKQFS